MEKKQKKKTIGSSEFEFWLWTVFLFHILFGLDTPLIVSWLDIENAYVNPFVSAISRLATQFFRHSCQLYRLSIAPDRFKCEVTEPKKLLSDRLVSVPVAETIQTRCSLQPWPRDGVRKRFNRFVRDASRRHQRPITPRCREMPGFPLQPVEPRARPESGTPTVTGRPLGV